MSRRPLVAANWKMYKTATEAQAFLRDIRSLATELENDRLAGEPIPEIVICPPFTAIAVAAGALAKLSSLVLGAQNMHQAREGAYTGEISAPMLADMGVSYVILGHSERRQHFGETDELIAEKVQAAFAHGITPILCVGETLAQRDAGQTNAVVAHQVTVAAGGLTREQASQLVVAYEPVWAIGTGRPSSAGDAGAVAAHIRGVVAERYGSGAAQAVRIQYGGSVKPGNAAEFLQHPEIDGALVGGASLEASQLTAIVKAIPGVR